MTDKDIQAELIQLNITLNFNCAIYKPETDIAFLWFVTYWTGTFLVVRKCRKKGVENQLHHAACELSEIYNTQL